MDEITGMLLLISAAATAALIAVGVVVLRHRAMKRAAEPLTLSRCHMDALTTIVLILLVLALIGACAGERFKPFPLIVTILSTLLLTIKLLVK